VTFVLSRVVPADPAVLLAGPSATSQQIEAIRESLGLNQPIHVQLYHYLAGLVLGNWGYSIVTRFPVLESILAVLPNTLTLVTLAMTLAFTLAIPIGVLAAVKRDSVVDHAAKVFSASTVALPSFWLGMVLQLVFFFLLREAALPYLPLSGIVDEIVLLQHPVRSITGSLLVDSLITGNLQVFVSTVAHLVLPVLTLAAFATGTMIRQIRSAMVSVLGQEYIRTARAYGLSSRMIHYRLALKNAILPSIVLLGLIFAGSMIAVIFVESIFALPGLGSLAVNAIGNLDYPLIVGVAIFVSIIYVVSNLVVDVVQAYLDRRIAL
jgi:peptide/nickel transport system permease protein